MPPIPTMHLYRHPEIQTGRPYAFDVDADGWLWEGFARKWLYAHNIHTAEARKINLPKVIGGSVNDVKCFGGKLVLALQRVDEYLVYDPITGTATAHPLPGKMPTVWYQQILPDGRLVQFERNESQLVILEEPGGAQRVVKSPFEGGIGAGQVFSDGLLYMFSTEPTTIVRFDPAADAFMDQLPCPIPDAGLAGSFEHNGIIYISDSSNGRLLTFDIKTETWGEPIPIPGYGEVFGFCGGCTAFQGRGYFSLSTYQFRSRLDRETGKLILPEGWDVGVDGFKPRFLDKQLVFDPATGAFDFLTVPAQPDGIPLICYQWTDGKKLIFTGYIIPFGKPGEPTDHAGDWIVWQSEEAADEPGYGPYDFSFDRKAHIDKYRRTVTMTESLYLPCEPHTPMIANVEGAAVSYQVGLEQILSRRAAKTDPAAYYRSILDVIAQPGMSDAEKVTAVLRFVNWQHFYNPVRETGRGPNQIIRNAEAHDIRCGDAANMITTLLGELGIDSRIIGVNHHVVAEANYDGGWHICDALFFGTDQPKRDGRVLSVDELKADPYFADAWSQECFVFDPETLLSVDGYHQLGYNFGVWGWEPYYSYYMFGDFDAPPTLPTVLPVVRIGENRVRLRWVESAKRGGGKIEYEVGVYADRRQREPLFTTLTTDTSLEWDVPEQKRMYFIGVKAMDDHRLKNPATWYPKAVSNFVLVDPGTYGWFNVF